MWAGLRSRDAVAASVILCLRFSSRRSLLRRPITSHPFPGYGFTKFPHYSGFLNASAAEDGTYLHYWLATYTASDKPWTKAPTVLWLNGGPGASSLLGMLQEQGPLIIDSSGKLVENPYAWTDVANLIALESPAGVGYSYCAAMASGGSCANTDVSTAKAAYAALVDFFTKFPELQKNPFYITGESYAGVYCPTLAAEIVSGNMHSAVKIDLVGMAVGDPCTDTQAQKQSMDMLWYAHKNGLVQDNEYDFLVNKCGASMPSDRMAGEWVADKSARVVPSKPTRPKLLSTSANCTAAMRRYLVASSKGISQSWDHAFINELSFYSPAAEFRFDIPGTLNYHTAKWMMAADVKAALHVATAPVKAWPGPAPGWKYTSSYDACNAAPPAPNRWLTSTASSHQNSPGRLSCTMEIRIRASRMRVLATRLLRLASTRSRRTELGSSTIRPRI